MLKIDSYVSGNNISDSMGVSKMTISNWISQLVALGLPIEVTKGRGYKLKSKVTLLSASEIQNSLYLGAFKNRLNVVCLETVDSTNKVALNDVNSSAEWDLIATEHQVEGRGRRGRSWESAPYQNLAFSVGTTVDIDPVVISTGSLIAGLAVIKGLLNVSDADFNENRLSLKWPNDVYLDGLKLAGILCELKGSPIDPCRLVIGVGLNAAISPSIKEYATANYADCLKSEVSRSDIVASITHSIIREFDKAQQADLGVVLTQWSKYDFLFNKKVDVWLGPKCLSGHARGIDNDGRLVVIDADKVKHAISGGEVSVRAV